MKYFRINQFFSQLLLFCLLPACSKPIYLNAQLVSEKIDETIEFTVLLSSEEPTKLVLYSDAKDSLLLGSLTHTFVAQEEFILTERDSSKIRVKLSPGEPYAIKFTGNLVRLGGGKMKLDFGSQGYIEGKISEIIALNVVVFPELNSVFGSNEGIPSNSIEVKLSSE